MLLPRWQLLECCALRNLMPAMSSPGYCHDGCVICSKSSLGGQIDSSITCKRCHHAKAFVKKDTTESPTSPLLLQVRDHPKIKTVSELPKIKISIPPSAPVKLKEEARNGSSAAKTRNTSWGIIWNKKSIDDIGPVFRKENILLRGNADVNRPGPVCKLCEKPYNPNLIYIRCPSCLSECLIKKKTVITFAAYFLALWCFASEPPAHLISGLDHIALYSLHV